MNTPQKPTGTPEQRLTRLQKEFRPDDVRISLNLLKDKSEDGDFQPALLDYIEALERLEAFTRNGHSCKGLWFNYEPAEKVV